MGDSCLRRKLKIKQIIMKKMYVHLERYPERAAAIALELCDELTDRMRTQDMEEWFPLFFRKEPL